MNQKETKQVVETQESKEKMVVLKRSPKWWIGMAAVGGLLVGAGSGFGVGVIASQSSNNQQFSQPVQTGQNPYIQCGIYPFCPGDRRQAGN